MHALIIEDECAVANFIEDVLRGCGYSSFDIVRSAHSAILVTALRRPDIITSEVRLKSGCGVAAVEAIPQGPSIPTVFITTYGHDLTRRALNCPVVDKPFTARTLTAAVASAMLEVSNHNAERANRASPTRAERL